jgi:CBS domain containing-hemolysin-like protein
MEDIMEEVFTRVKEMKAKDFPIRKVPIVYEDTSCSDLLNFLVEDKSLVAMVFNHKNEFIGLLTIRNMLNLLSPRKTDLTDVLTRTHVLSCITALDLLQSDIPIVKDEDNIERVAGLMKNYNTVFLPRQSERKSMVKGLIFLEDILGTLQQNWIGSCIDMDD